MFRVGAVSNLKSGRAKLARSRFNYVDTVVFTSSVFGSPLPSHIDDATPLRPILSYGTHKQMNEIFLADCTRRGFVKGRSVRLPAIVARPPSSTGALSAFSSELIRALVEGRPYTCPVSPGATMWLMSEHQ